MSEFRFPVPGSCLRKMLDKLSSINGYRFSENEAIADLMLAVDRERRNPDLFKMKPASYYAKRWGWGRTTVYDKLPDMLKTVQEWRDLSPDALRTHSGRTPDEKQPNLYQNGTSPDALRTHSGRTPDGIEQTTNSNLNKTNLNNLNKLKPNHRVSSARAKFSPPVLADVQEYMKKFSNDRNIRIPAGVEAEKFFDHFESNGWRVSGKSPMKDWKAACRKWIRNWQEGAFAPGSRARSKQRGYNEESDIRGNSGSVQDTAGSPSRSLQNGVHSGKARNSSHDSRAKKWKSRKSGESFEEHLRSSGYSDDEIREILFSSNDYQNNGKFSGQNGSFR